MNKLNGVCPIFAMGNFWPNEGWTPCSPSHQAPGRVSPRLTYLYFVDGASSWQCPCASSWEACVLEAVFSGQTVAMARLPQRARLWLDHHSGECCSAQEKPQHLFEAVYSARVCRRCSGEARRQVSYILAMFCYSCNSSRINFMHSLDSDCLSVKQGYKSTCPLCFLLCYIL